MGGPLELWFEYASTYSYPATARAPEAASAAGVALAWRPFLLGPIFRAQGWNDSPFNLYPVKGRYMWRDLERICEEHEIPFRRPSRFPRNGLLAARVTVAVQDEDWAPELVRAVYRANFAEDREISEPAVLVEILDEIGRDGRALVEAAGSPEVKGRLREQTDRAIALGIFGAPSFVANGELFWGNDRLEEAIEWMKR